MSADNSPGVERSGFAPGDAVVEFRPSRGADRHAASMTFTEVVKVGKRDIVLANEHRFNVTRPRKRNGSWEPDTELLHADDPRVGLARQAARRARAKSAVRTAYEAWLKEQTLVAGTALAAAVFDWQAEQSDDSGTP